jgi:hypothetical protein
VLDRQRGSGANTEAGGGYDKLRRFSLQVGLGHWACGVHLRVLDGKRGSGSYKGGLRRLRAVETVDLQQLHIAFVALLTMVLRSIPTVLCTRV